MTRRKTKIIDFPPSSQAIPTSTGQAAKWAADMYADDVTESKREQFSIWYAESEENRTAFKHIEQSWAVLDFVTLNDPELDAELDAIARKTTMPVARLFSRRMVASIAATLLVIVGALTLFMQGMVPPENQRYMTAIGEIKMIELADGSKITLAGESIFETNFSNIQRKTTLIDGQAYFDVMRDPERPFLVRTNGTEISVLGTEFDIQKTTADVRISVTEGVVAVADVHKNTAPIQEVDVELIKASPVKLNIGEQIYVASDGSHSTITSFEQDSLLSWREGVLEYYNDPLSRVIEEVNRYRQIKITLADDNLADMPVTIAFATDKTDNLFEGLELTGIVDVIRTPQGITIRSK